MAAAQEGLRREEVQSPIGSHRSEGTSFLPDLKEEEARAEFRALVAAVARKDGAGWMFEPGLSTCWRGFLEAPEGFRRVVADVLDDPGITKSRRGVLKHRVEAGQHLEYQAVVDDPPDPMRAAYEAALERAVRFVYEEWRQSFGRSDRRYEQISPARRAVIVVRLTELAAAYDGDVELAGRKLAGAAYAASRDPWEERTHNTDLTVLFRTQEAADRWLDAADGYCVERDETELLAEALAEQLGAAATRTEQARLASVARELHAAGATPEEVDARVAEYRRRWPRVELTPAALARHWSALAHRSTSRSGGMTAEEISELAERERERELAESGTPAVADDPRAEVA